MITKRLVIFLGVFVSLLNLPLLIHAPSYGVSPAIHIIDFSPGLSKSFDFVFASDDPSGSFTVNVTGDLAEYVSLDKNEFQGGQGKVIATINLPNNIEVPGPHKIFVGALPKVDNRGRRGTSVGITARVNGVIKVLVPYPGKYADLQFGVSDANAGEKSKYTLKIFSRGEEEITTLSRIEVFDSDDNKVAEFDVGADSILSTEHVEINLEMDVSHLSAGIYKAVAIVTYSGEEKRAESNFRLGNLEVDILNYTREFDREKINPMYIQIESGWNDLIPDVFATGEVIGNSTISFETASIELRPWKKANLVGHFDTTGLDENFQMDLVIHYGNTTTETTADLKLRKKEINYLFWGGIILGVLIVVGFVVWIVRKLNRLEKKGKLKKKTS